ncbi:Dabb family protein [Coprobacter tertius]|uniref:Dabb family protein n=1 Tax=Coprobacter tertius TaxID=2944915 RepID=A0ABT1MJQ1_9BACT|nr:Dabb family protein [Coprobacter tertius]MCP9612847.1 Dabb family protein [Coprobacter tertius]
MIRHIVLFKLKRMESSKAKMEIMQRFKSALEALKDIIPELKSIEVGINVNSAEDYDVALVTVFDNMHDLSVYANHPEHLAAAAIIKDVKEGRACVDYEF